MRLIGNLSFLLFCIESFTSKNDDMVFAKRDTILGKWQLFDTCISLGSECVLKEIKEGIITEYIAV